MEKRLMMFMVSLFLCAGSMLAQTKVSGTVLSQEDGQPIIGAAVKVVGTSTGLLTDVNGKFTLTLPDGKDQLEITYLGYEGQTVKAKNGMRVFLKTDAKLVDEVIVVAYGTAKKSAFTGSATQVTSQEIGKVQVNNAADALKGKVAGVQLTNLSGAPGSAPSLRIRGINSVNADKNPLIVVDGVAYGENFDLNTISTQDIESETVLKDAASAALYGARGANGVVLITTKKGREGTSSITVDAKWGSNSKGTPFYDYIRSPEKYYEVWYASLNSYAKNNWGYNDAQAYAWANANLTAANSYGLAYNVFNVPEGQNLIGRDGKLNPNAKLGNVITGVDGNQYMLYPDSWYDEAYKHSLRQEYSISANGSNQKGSYYASFNYLDNEGITVKSGFKRLSGRLKADYQVKDWIKVAGNFGYTHYEADQTNPDEEGSTGSSGNIFAMTGMAPIYPIYVRDANGNIVQDQTTGLPRYDYGNAQQDLFGINRPYLSQANPLSANQLDVMNYEGNTFSASGSAEIRFLKDFKFTTTNSVHIDETRTTSTTNPYYGQYASSNGIVYKYHNRGMSTNFLQQLDWSHSFGLHNIEAMIAHEAYKYKYYYLYGYRNNQFSPSNTELSGAVIVGSTNSYTSDFNTEGYFGRAQYNYDNKYFASASFRRDASSRFHKDHRWGNFWSAGAAWLMNKEKFLSDVKWLDELKLKASYGEQGNDNIGSYRYTTTYTIENASDNVSLVPYALGNQEISWETVGTFNAGIEFSVLKGRLTGGVEFYYKKTKDMLFYFSLPPSYGFGGYYDNIGDMRNTGLEFELRGDIIRTKDLTWSLYGNLATNSNKITYIPEENKTTDCDGVKGYVDGSYFIGEGISMYTLRYRKYAGVDENGVAQYWKDIVDSNGNVTGQEKVSNPSDATYHLCDTALPKVYGGFGTSFNYKGIDFSADFSYQLGGQVYDTTYAESMSGGLSTSVGRAFHVDVLNAWTPENTGSNIPRFQYGDQYMASASDRWITSSNYLSLNNITLGYTLPMSLTTKIGVSKIRLYAVADNVWVWSKRQGLDPRMSITGGGNASYYSAVRTISGGISVTF